MSTKSVNAEKSVEFVGQLSDLVDQRNKAIQILNDLFLLCDAYGVRATPEECHKAINAQAIAMRDLLLPDFDDSE